MNFYTVPIIILLCYLFGEIFKVIFKNKKDLYKLIPVIVCILGGVLGAVIYMTTPCVITNADNVWTSIGTGIVSGASSTGANQIIKQIFKSEWNERITKINKK